MSVLIEGFNVVAKRSTVSERYPGGFASFLEDCPVAAVCADDYIVRVGFMDPRDLDAYAAALEDNGLHMIIDNKYGDFAIIYGDSRLDRACPWLEFGRLGDGKRIAWEAGSDPGRVVVPEGWSREAAMIYIPQDRIDDERLVPVRSAGDFNYYKDTEGKLCYTIRAR